MGIMKRLALLAAALLAACAFGRGWRGIADATRTSLGKGTLKMKEYYKVAHRRGDFHGA